MNTGDLLSEIDELQSKLENLSKKPEPVSTNFSWAYLFTGMFFYLLFLFSFTLSLPFAGLISVVSFLISTAALLRICADLIQPRSRSTLQLLLIPTIFILLSINAYVLWSEILLQYTLALFIVYGAALGVATIFFAMNAVMAYYQNHAHYELKITFLILIISWLLLLILGLYNSVIWYLLLTAALALLCKALVDFSGRFVKNV